MAVVTSAPAKYAPPKPKGLGKVAMQAAAKKAGLTGVGKGFYRNTKTKKVYKWTGQKLVARGRPASMLTKPAPKPGAHLGAPAMKASAQKLGLKGVGKGYYRNPANKKVYLWNGSRFVPRGRPASMLTKPAAAAKPKPKDPITLAAEAAANVRYGAEEQAGTDLDRRILSARDRLLPAYYKTYAAELDQGGKTLDTAQQGIAGDQLNAYGGIKQEMEGADRSAQAGLLERAQALGVHDPGIELAKRQADNNTQLALQSGQQQAALAGLRNASQRSVSDSKSLMAKSQTDNALRLTGAHQEQLGKLAQLKGEKGAYTVQEKQRLGQEAFQRAMQLEQNAIARQSLGEKAREFDVDSALEKTLGLGKLKDADADRALKKTIAKSNTALGKAKLAIARGQLNVARGQLKVANRNAKTAEERAANQKVANQIHAAEARARQKHYSNQDATAAKKLGAQIKGGVFKPGSGASKTRGGGIKIKTGRGKTVTLTKAQYNSFLRGRANLLTYLGRYRKAHDPKAQKKAFKGSPPWVQSAIKEYTHHGYISRANYQVLSGYMGGLVPYAFYKNSPWRK